MSAEDCALLRDLSSNIAYQAIIALKLSLCCAGVAGISYQWRKQGVRFLVHDNSKVAFHFYYALNAFAGAIFVLSYTFELIRLRLDCYLLDFRLVLLSKATAVCALFAGHHIIVMLSIERLYSSLYPAHFEGTSNRRLAFLLSITVIAATWLYTMSCFSDRYKLFFESNTVVFYEERLPTIMKYFNELATVALISTTTSLFIFSLDVYLNFIRIPVESNPSLAISYQRSENRRVILTIFPIELMESSIALFFTVTQILHEKFSIGNTTPIGRMIFLELTDYTMLNSLIIAIVIELRVARRNRETVTSICDDVDYFEHLKRAWN